MAYDSNETLLNNERGIIVKWQMSHMGYALAMTHLYW